MKVRAVTKSIRISPRKVRLVVDAVRNLSIDDAFRVLQITEKKAGTVIAKTLQSAVANAANNANLDKNNLVIARMMVNEGVPLKRFHPSTRGRVHAYKKRSSILEIVLEEKAAPLVKSEVVEPKKGGEK